MERTFGITPASIWPLVFIVVVSLILVAVLGLLVFIGYSSRNVKFEITTAGLRIRNSVYGRFIPRSEIITQNARTVDLNTEAALKPVAKTNGAGLPGYSEGWFKLRNGEKALLFVTDNAKVVYLPTNSQYALLLSVSSPDDFFSAVRLVWR